MEDFNNSNEEFKHREDQLKKREQDLRLRELEIELYEKDKKKQEAPLYPTFKHNKISTKNNSGIFIPHKLTKLVKVFGFVIVGLTIVQLSILISYVLSRLLMAGIIGLVIYFIFGDET